MKLLLALTLLLAGCASAPTSPGDALGAAYIAADAIVVTTHELCRNEVPGGRCAPNAPLKTHTKDRIAEQMRAVATLLADARGLLAAGQEAQAMDALTRARFLLRTAETLLLEAQR